MPITNRTRGRIYVASEQGRNMDSAFEKDIMVFKEMIDGNFGSFLLFAHDYHNTNYYVRSEDVEEYHAAD